MLGNIKTTSFAVLASIVIGIAATGTASAAPCKQHRHAGVSDLHTARSYAIRHAKGRWFIAVKHHDGKPYARWQFARNKSLAVFRIGKRWRAHARGRGCMGPSSLTTLAK